MYREDGIKPSFWGLMPFILFFLFYIGMGVILHIKGVKMAFSQMPPVVAMFIAVVLTFAIFKDSFTNKVDKFVKGCAQQDVIFVALIFLLSGAFSTVCKEIGGVETVVNIGLKYIPSNLLVSGIFLISLFLSLSTGSFIGTIVAIAPIALEIADKGNIPIPLVSGAIFGGGAFGDNMSLISDTSIISSRTQGVKVVDVFRNGIFYTLPAAFLAIIVFAFLGSYNKSALNINLEDINYFKVVPYLFVMIFAISGVDVFLVLFLGIFVAGVIGICFGDITFLSISKKINEGFLGLGEIFFLVIFTGGISYMAIQYGGFDWLLLRLKKMSKCKRSSEFVITFLVGVLTVCLANNGLAILMSGSVVKAISRDYSLNPKRISSLLCMSSCFFLSILPHSIHIIGLINFTEGKLAPFDILPFLVYQDFLALFVILSIIGFDIRRLINFLFRLK